MIKSRKKSKKLLYGPVMVHRGLVMVVVSVTPKKDKGQSRLKNEVQNKSPKIARNMTKSRKMLKNHKVSKIDGEIKSPPDRSPCVTRGPGSGSGQVTLKTTKVQNRPKND